MKSGLNTFWSDFNISGTGIQETFVTWYRNSKHNWGEITHSSYSPKYDPSTPQTMIDTERRLVSLIGGAHIGAIRALLDT
jgi:hypothetical protein